MLLIQPNNAWHTTNDRHLVRIGVIAMDSGKHEHSQYTVTFHLQTMQKIATIFFSFSDYLEKRKTQLTQRGTRNSGACVKAQ